MKHCLFVVTLLFILLFIFSLSSHGADSRTINITERSKNKTLNCVAIKVDGLWSASCSEKRIEYNKKEDLSPTKVKPNSRGPLNPMEALLGTRL